MRAYQIDPRPLLKSVKPVRNPAYLKFIRSQLCCATGRNWGVEACHTGPHAHSQKASDLDAIPLIAELHTVGQYALDKIGREAFEQHWGVSIPKVIQTMQARAEACGITLVPPERKGMGKARRSTYRRRAA
jgi:hypothetical protein